MKTLGERIKALRIPGETQMNFAERLETTQASISRYLNGRQPDRETLIRIARKTGVSLDWLMTGKGPGPRETGEKKGKGDDFDWLASGLESVNTLSSRDKDRLKTMVLDLLGNKETRKEVLACWDNCSKRGRK